MNTTPPFDPADVEAVAHLIKTHMWIRHDSAMDDASLVGADESAAAIMTLLAQRGRLVEPPEKKRIWFMYGNHTFRGFDTEAEALAWLHETTDEDLRCVEMLSPIDGDNVHSEYKEGAERWRSRMIAALVVTATPPADRSNHAAPTPSPCRTVDGSRAGVADGDAGQVQDGRGGAVDDAEASKTPAEPVVTEAGDD